ncbi:hypothetical protein H0H81_012381 [Sphagnurus paluster]|uniref:Endopeptidase S2P n=1 Tax=Sphagnurus paluster TaxID=117069 RepID=A0A9P7FQK9_9AGAR|nr:hypothetical protein H0H81_012381 [Sphagnurus paluster]
MSESLASTLLVLTLVWCAIHALHRLLKPSSAQTLLPSSSVRTRRNAWHSSSTRVVLHGLHLRVQTTAWNLQHDLLSASLKRPHRAPLVRTLKAFYNAGSVLGVVGMLCALGFLFTTGTTSALSLASKLLASSAPLARRGLDVQTTEPTSWVKPIIPGVTVPLAHLPIILLAVFFAQFVHELGHALAAAMYGPSFVWVLLI